MKKIKILHIISGGDTGGARTHLISLMKGLKDIAKAKVICFINDTFYKILKAEGINIEVYEQKSRLDLSVTGRIAKEIEESGVDILHAHGARANFIAMFLRKKIKIPFVTTIHSDYELDFTDNFYKKIIFTSLNKAALKKFDAYITVSENFKNMMLERGFPEKKLFTVYNGIDTKKELKVVSKEEFLLKNGIDPEGWDIVFGISARLDKVKDHETFLRAVERANEKEKKILYLMAGDGNQREILKKIIAEKKLDNVKMLGHQSDIYSFYNAIDVNVLTSLSESFPYSLLEGGLFEKTVIATEVGGIPKLVNKDTGLLFEVGDDKRLSEFFSILAKDIDERKRLGRNLKLKIEKEFSSEAMALSHIEIYKKIIERHKNKVLMLGYYGYDNSGDEAILGAIIEDLRGISSEIQITALSKNPEKTESIYKIKSVNRFSLPSLIKAMRETNLFLFGGGTLLQDRTSTRSIRYYLFLLGLADFFKKKVMVYANGLGPISGKKNRMLAKKALEKADFITLRDTDSYEYLLSLGVKNPNLKITGDPVFSLKSESLSKKIPNTVAVSVRDWDDRKKIVTEMRAFLELLVEKKWRVLLFAMHYPNDLEISREIAQGFGESVKVLEENYSAREIISLLESVDITVAMRLHALIYSAMAKTPMIGISYDPKIDGLLFELKIKAKLSTENFSGKLLYDRFNYTIENLDKIKAVLDREVLIKKKAAKENAEIAIRLLGE